MLSPRCSWDVAVVRGHATPLKTEIIITLRFAEHFRYCIPDITPCAGCRLHHTCIVHHKFDTFQNGPALSLPVIYQVSLESTVCIRHISSKTSSRVLALQACVRQESWQYAPSVGKSDVNSIFVSRSRYHSLEFVNSGSPRQGSCVMCLRWVKRISDK